LHIITTLQTFRAHRELIREYPVQRASQTTSYSLLYEFLKIKFAVENHEIQKYFSIFSTSHIITCLQISTEDR